MEQSYPSRRDNQQRLQYFLFLSSQQWSNYNVIQAGETKATIKVNKILEIMDIIITNQTAVEEIQKRLLSNNRILILVIYCQV